MHCSIFKYCIVGSLMKSWGGQCGQPADSHSFFPLDHKQCWQASSNSTCTKLVILVVLVPSRTTRFTLKCGLCYLSQGVTVHAPCLPRQLLTGVPKQIQLGAFIGRDSDSNGTQLTSSPHPEYLLSLPSERVV